jgi:hypothetical protein
MIALTDSIDDYLPSMYLDNAQRRPMELDAMYGVPLDTARKAGCSMPKVQTLYHALRFIEARNSSQPAAMDSIPTAANGRVASGRKTSGPSNDGPAPGMDRALSR